MFALIIIRHECFASHKSKHQQQQIVLCGSQTLALIECFEFFCRRFCMPVDYTALTGSVNHGTTIERNNQAIDNRNTCVSISHFVRMCAGFRFACTLYGQYNNHNHRRWPWTVFRDCYSRQAEGIRNDCKFLLCNPLCSNNTRPIHQTGQRFVFIICLLFAESLFTSNQTNEWNENKPYIQCFQQICGNVTWARPLFIIQISLTIHAWIIAFEVNSICHSSTMWNHLSKGSDEVE